MPRFALIACALLALFARNVGAQEIPASVAFPGSFWISAGDVVPAERGNVLGQAAFEQGITVWERGSWFLIPHVNVSLMADSYGYEWNNRSPARVGVKIVRRIPGGMVQAGGGMMIEPGAESGEQRHPTAVVDYWSGWAAEGRGTARRELRRIPRLRLGEFRADCGSRSAQLDYDSGGATGAGRLP